MEQRPISKLAVMSLLLPC